MLPRLLAISAFMFVATLSAQEKELQCKCTQLQGNEYLCRCPDTGASAVPSAITLPAPNKQDPPAAPAAQAEAAPKSAAPTLLRTPTGEKTASGAEIYTGPRGGPYHISSSGKKVYERKK